jgi:NADPH2:quinone reductase
VDQHQLRSDAPAAHAVDDFFVLQGEPLGSLVARATDGRGAQVIFDAVGGPMFEPGLKALGHYGRQVEIASVGNRRVSFDLLDFYHNESRLFGVDTRHRDATASAALLEALTPFFDDGLFQPPVIDQVIPLSDGRMAYQQVAQGDVRGRVVLVP